MKKIILMSVLAMVAASQGELIVYDSFTAPTNARTGGWAPAGWTVIDTNAASANAYIKEGSLTVAGLKESEGNSLGLANKTSDYYLNFSTVTLGVGDTVYFSFIQKFNVIPGSTVTGAGGYIRLGNTNDAVTVTKGVCISRGSSGAPAASNAGFALSANSAVYATAGTHPKTAGTYGMTGTYFIVGSYTRGSGATNGSLKLWINPDSATFGTANPPTPTLSMASLSSADTFNRLLINANGSTSWPADWQVDEVRVGTDWASVAPSIVPTYYLDPVNGSLANSGTAQNPLPGLAAVINAGMIQSKKADGTPRNPSGLIPDGSRLRLLSGYHGDPSIVGYFQDSGIRVEPSPGQSPKLGLIRLVGGTRWTFSGLDISPSYRSGTLPAYIVSIEDNVVHGTSSFIRVENCLISSTNDISGWTTTNQWISLTTGGLQLFGKDNSAVSNTVINISMGMSLNGERGYAGYNIIQNFRIDGMRTLNHDCTAEYNTILNAYKVDGNHMDGIQGFKYGAPGTEVRGLMIRGNTILRHQNPSALFVSPYLQGIGFFDGPFTNCVFENNLVMALSSHGISVYNANGCRIINNTVVGDGTAGAFGKILLDWKTNVVGNIKNNVIRNNLADYITVNTNAVGTVLSSNLLFSASVTRQQVFVDAANRDYQLRTNSPAIDAGSSVDAPAVDIEGTVRPQGARVDIGAYEYVPQ